MNISVFGLGYVGVVSAVCLARRGHIVVGVDSNAAKVQMIVSGRSPIIEAGVEDLISESISTGKLRATCQATEAVLATDMSLICVGTPCKENGAIDLTFVERVCEEIGHALAEKSAYHVVALRSTVLPGTTQKLVIPALERASGKREGRDFAVAFNPEFMRESTAIHDFEQPPKTVIGANARHDAEQVAVLYDGISAPLFMTDIRVSEMVKYVDNAFHALKVTFANEIGVLCKSVGVDSHDVMDVFCSDTKLNLSSQYLKPGFAFGGSCLPKDLRAITYQAKTLDLEIPLLNTVRFSNDVHVHRIVEKIRSYDKRRIGILGFAFKAGTDDLRESPIVSVAETLLGKGFDLRIFDQSVSLAKLFGANKEFIEKRIPHLSALMVETLEDIASHSELIIIGTRDRAHQEVLTLLHEHQTVLDLVRISNPVRTKARYEGICW